MRLLMVSNHPYFPQQVGGREWVMHETAIELRREGHDAAIICGLAPAGWLYYRNRLTSAVTRRACPGDKLQSYAVFRGWPLEVGLQQVVRRLKPTAAIIEGGGNAVPLVRRLLEFGVPTVVRLHDSSLHLLNGTPRELPGVPFVAVSEFLSARFRDTFGETAFVIPPLISSHRCTTHTTRTRVVCVNPRKVKGGDIVIALAERHPDIPFRFFEAWAQDDEIKAYRARAQRLRNVEWMKPVMDPREIYRDAHCVLVPSQGNETWGRVATEAQFSGIPVIATNRGGLPEAVGPGGMLIGPEGGVDEWSEALLAVWTDVSLYRSLSQRAAEFARRPEIAVDTLMKRTHQVIEQARSHFPRARQ